MIGKGEKFVRWKESEENNRVDEFHIAASCLGRGTRKEALKEFVDKKWPQKSVQFVVNTLTKTGALESDSE